jgi:hypothetical protein
MESKADPLARLQRLTAWLAVLGLRYAPGYILQRTLRALHQIRGHVNLPAFWLLLIVLELVLVLDAF